MPELPDVVNYVESLRRLTGGKVLQRIRLTDPFILRSVDPSPSELEGKVVTDYHRMGKRIIFELEDELFIVLHLMIAGRLRWRPPETKIPKRNGLGAFDFENGRVLLTEAGKKRRARLHMVRGRQALAEHDPGGLEVLEASLEEFQEVLQRRNHTLRRVLTDPRLFSGIGNAYSDEILHRARLSPVKQSQRMSDQEVAQLHSAVIEVMQEWTRRFRDEIGDGFPEKVTAFRPEMAVHGRYQEPCPVCGTPVARIRYADNETNYCPTCQNEGRLLADRSLSKLLKKDWPKTPEELELKRRGES